MSIIKLGKMRVGELAERLIQGETLSLRFYNRRVGVIVPAPHQAQTVGVNEAFHDAVMGLAAEFYPGLHGQLKMKRVDIVKLARELLGKFGENGEEIE